MQAYEFKYFDVDWRFEISNLDLIREIDRIIKLTIF